MTTETSAGAAMAVSATEKPRSIAPRSFRLLPVPARAIPGWDARIARWAAA